MRSQRLASSPGETTAEPFRIPDAGLQPLLQAFFSAPGMGTWEGCDVQAHSTLLEVAWSISRKSADCPVCFGPALGGTEALNAAPTIGAVLGYVRQGDGLRLVRRVIRDQALRYSATEDQSVLVSRRCRSDGTLPGPLILECHRKDASAL